jgi:hypothetical protein
MRSAGLSPERHDDPARHGRPFQPAHFIIIFLMRRGSFFDGLKNERSSETGAVQGFPLASATEPFSLRKLHLLSLF